MNHPVLELYKMELPEVMKFIMDSLWAAGYDVYSDDDNYIVGVPPETAIRSKVALVAHFDTLVPKDRVTGLHLKPVELEVVNGVVRNKNGVLGADDRSGVYANLTAMAASVSKPIMIFTNYEEVQMAYDNIGVKRLISDSVLVPFLNDIFLFVEPDRKGFDEYVYYTWGIPKSVEQLMSKYGYHEEQGTYSDVADLSEAYDIPHVNISVGYRDQHKPTEYQNLVALDWTVGNIMQLIDDEAVVQSAIPTRPKPKRVSSGFGRRNYGPGTDPWSTGNAGWDRLALSMGAAEDPIEKSASTRKDVLIETGVTFKEIDTYGIDYLWAELFGADASIEEAHQQIAGVSVVDDFPLEECTFCYCKYSTVDLDPVSGLCPDCYDIKDENLASLRDRGLVEANTRSKFVESIVTFCTACGLEEPNPLNPGDTCSFCGSEMSEATTTSFEVVEKFCSTCSEDGIRFYLDATGNCLNCISAPQVADAVDNVRAFCSQCGKSHWRSELTFAEGACGSCVFKDVLDAVSKVETEAKSPEPEEAILIPVTL